MLGSVASRLVLQFQKKNIVQKAQYTCLIKKVLLKLQVPEKAHQENYQQIWCYIIDCLNKVLMLTYLIGTIPITSKKKKNTHTHTHRQRRFLLSFQAESFFVIFLLNC